MQPGPLVRAAQLFVEMIDLGIQAGEMGDFDSLRTCLLFVRETQRKFATAAQDVRGRLTGPTKDITNEEWKDLVDRCVLLLRLENAVGVLVGQVEQRLVDAGQLVRPH